jgi:hypothetical protein
MQNHDRFTSDTPNPGGGPTDPGPADNADKADKRSGTARILDALHTGISELFHDGPTPYAAVSGDSGPLYLTLESAEFKAWATQHVYQMTNYMFTAAQWEQCRNQLMGEARFKGPEHRVYLRVAPADDGGLWIDLGHGQYVSVAAHGWSVERHAGVRFRKPSRMAALPVPVPGGHVRQLRPFVNCEEAEFFTLVAFVLAALRPTGPYPILEISGEMGSAKSTTTRLVRMLIDPHANDLRGAVRSEQQLAVQAQHCHLVVLDNVSAITPDISDVLCRLSTGGEYGARRLYSDLDEVTVQLYRPCAMNGIGAIIERSDLMDRCWPVGLKALERGARMSEAAYWAKVQTVLPAVFGAILDGLVTAVRDVHTVRLDDSGRLVDAESWATAAETGLRLPAGTFVSSLRQRTRAALWRAMDADPDLWDTLEQLARRPHGWRGTVTELMRLTDRAHLKPNVFGTQLSKLKPFLAQAGILLDSFREGHASTRGYTLNIVDGIGGVGGTETTDVA